MRSILLSVVAATALFLGSSYNSTAQAYRGFGRPGIGIGAPGIGVRPVGPRYNYGYRGGYYGRPYYSGYRGYYGPGYGGYRGYGPGVGVGVRF